MSAKKMTPSRKKTTKNQSQSKPILLSAKMEQAFKNLPRQLSAQYRDELMSLKQQTLKLNTELKKLQLQEKKRQTNFLSLQTTKPKSIQVKKAKKLYEQAAKATKVLMVKLNQLEKDKNALTAKRNSFVELTTQLKQLEKNKSQQSVTIMSKPKLSNKKKTSEPTMIEVESADVEMES